MKRLCGCGCGRPTSGRFDPATGGPVRYVDGHVCKDPAMMRKAMHAKYRQSGQCRAVARHGGRCGQTVNHDDPDDARVGLCRVHGTARWLYHLPPAKIHPSAAYDTPPERP